MTRTARKSTKKEPLPATPWEELKQPYRNQNEGMYTCVCVLVFVCVATVNMSVFQEMIN